MVLSNKKLKQKLRAAKAELLAAAEAQSNDSTKDFKKLGNADSKELHPLKLVMNTEAKRVELSKREKRRQKAAQSKEIVKQRQSVGGVEEKVEDGLKSSGGDKKTKRKRDEGEAAEKQGIELKSSGGEKKKKRKRDEGEAGEKVGDELESSRGNMKKRKRDKPEAAEKVKEERPKQSKKKKKHKHKRKPKKNVENRQIKEEANKQNGSVASGEQLAADAYPTGGSRKELEPSTKVYVGGIPYYSTEDDIRSYFESCGTIIDVDCMKFPDTGKFRGIALITFKTEAAAKRALAFDGSDMGGLFLKIQPYKLDRVVTKSSNFSPAVVEGYNRVYVGNLSWDVTEDDLRNLFSNCSITSIRFGEDKETGEFKGYAHVDFADSVSLNTALKLDQNIVCGRHVKISCAVQNRGTVSKLKSMPHKSHLDGNKVLASIKDQYISSAKVSAFSRDEESNSTAKVSAVSNDQENSSAMVNAVSKDQGNSSANFIAVSKDQDNSCTNFSAVSRNQANNSVMVTTDSKGQETNAEVTTAVSAKIRRRTCYECGEKGHISSLCPNKAADAVNPSAT